MLRFCLLALLAIAHTEEVCDSSEAFVEGVDEQKKGTSLLQVRGTQSAITLIAEFANESSKSIGTTAPLDESGYAEVKSTCCNAEMMKFAHRIIDEEGLEVCSKWGLMGLVPWFTCDQDKEFAGLLQRHVATQIDADNVRKELDSYKNSELRKKAAALGVDEKTLSKAEDSKDARSAVIELIVSAQGNHREEEAVHLASLHRSELRKMVESLGLETTEVEKAEDAADPVAAYVDLILASKGLSSSGQSFALTYAGLHEAILASQPPAKCAWVAPLESCPTGENLGPDCHGVHGFNDFTYKNCPPNISTPGPPGTTMSASTTTAVTTALTTTPGTTIATSTAPVTTTAVTTTVTTTPGTPEWVLTQTKAFCIRDQNGETPSGAAECRNAMLAASGKDKAELSSVEDCQHALQLVMEDPGQSVCSNTMQYQKGECHGFRPTSPGEGSPFWPCKEWMGYEGGGGDAVTDPVALSFWQYKVFCTKRSLDGACLSCISGFHVHAEVCKSTYLHGAMTYDASTKEELGVCPPGYGHNISSAAECTIAARLKGLDIVAAIEISDTTKQAGCSHFLTNSFLAANVDLFSTEVFFNTANGISVDHMAVICKAATAPAV